MKSTLFIKDRSSYKKYPEYHFGAMGTKLHKIMGPLYHMKNLKDGKQYTFHNLILRTARE